MVKLSSCALLVVLGLCGTVLGQNEPIVKMSQAYGSVQETNGKYAFVKPAVQPVIAPNQPNAYAQYGIPNPVFGPTEVYVYKNTMGTWKIPKGTQDTGTAKYTWDDGTKHEDTLQYIGFVVATNNVPNGLPQGAKVDAWAYLATDNQGNSWFFYLGVVPFNTPAGKRYPMFYSFRDPQDPNVNHVRILNWDGTQRY